MFAVLGFPLLKINIYSNMFSYLFIDPMDEQFCLFHIIVSCRLKPISLKYNACLNDVPVSLPLIVASPTTHTTTPPCFVTRYNSFAISWNFSKLHWDMLPLYVLRL